MEHTTEYNNTNNVKEYRDVRIIAKRILNQIPSEETHFINAVNKFISDCEYYAPEVLKGSDSWIPFTNILHIYIRSESDEWQKNIIKIYMGYE